MQVVQLAWARSDVLWRLLAAVAVVAAAPARAQTPDDFDPGASFTPEVIALQPDGEILVGGCHLTRDGYGILAGLARFSPGGSLDPSFNVAAGFRGGHGSVFGLAVEAGGSILAGSFDALNGEERQGIARLNADGSLQPPFTPSPGLDVYSLAVEADGKIVVGGTFTTLGGQPRGRLGRFHADGTLDRSFDTRANDCVHSVALQEDGKILVGGWFSKLGIYPRRCIGRLHANGAVDTTFNPGANGTVLAWAVQPDGKIVLGGDFTMVGGQTRNHLARLDPDGSLDSTFNPGVSGGTYPSVHTLALQTDGKILVGGDFTSMGGQPRSYLGRLNPDGSVDSNFDAGANGAVRHLVVEPEGKVLVAGSFTTLAGQARKYIGRLNNTTLSTEDLTYTNSSITWLRGESSPEVWRTTFDASQNGSEWVSLGAGRRIEGGWRLDGVSIPADASIRARGYVPGGQLNSSCWFVETIVGALRITSQPRSLANDAGTLASFSVKVAGNPPFDYQWFKDGVSLVESENASGAQSSTLVLKNILSQDAGDYSAVVSNSSGSVTSRVATLSVLDPAINKQPTGQKAGKGQTVVFSVLAAGTDPLNYQWRKDGVNLTAASAASMTLTNVQVTDAGGYDVVVRNGFGAVTSAVAILTVNAATPDNFNAEISGTIDSIGTMVVQNDGKILVAGSPAPLRGIPGRAVVRFSQDGTLDPAFSPEIGDADYSSPSVTCLGLQDDGRIVVGGSFNVLGGQFRRNIGRLNSDGTLDPTFNPGTDDSVSCLAFQADGKVLVGGYFASLGGQPRGRIGRLEIDGTLDSTFSPEVSGAPDDDTIVSSLAVQADGKILVGGTFTNLAGQPRVGLGRLNADGTLDTSFDPGPIPVVLCLAVQVDGKILVGGAFLSVGEQSRENIARLNHDGTLDTTFIPGADDRVYALAVQADGRIVVGGYFSSLGGQPRSCLARLLPDGTLDGTFDPQVYDLSGVQPWVSCVTVQPDGKILVGGGFTQLSGPGRNLGRLNNTDTATQTLFWDGLGVTWLRGGTSPEVWRTTFEISTNSSDWASLGAGIRIEGGWRLDGMLAPTNAAIRARGFVASGEGNGSAWFVESTLPNLRQNPPLVLVNDGGSGFHTNRFQFDVTGVAGQALVFEISLDLTNWTALATNILGSTPLHLSDPDSTNLQRFYRARLQ